MQIILKKNVRNLGALGEKVAVKAGFARNFLIPQGMAVPATADNLKAFEARRAELEQQAAAELTAAQNLAESITALGAVTIEAKAGDEGKLFGSVGTIDIAEALTKAGVEVTRQQVRLPLGALRHTGEHEVELHLHSDVEVVVQINVTAIAS